MLCAKCQSHNLPDAAFCNECGAKLEAMCSSCGLSNPLGSKFCRKCGSRLATVSAADAITVEHGVLREAPEGERRHLTVLFCDLVGSTEIASHLDPEEWREIVGDYHRAATQAIERFGGSIAQYLGDGVMAYFGYPEAHDNDAERSVRAGLDILETIVQLNQGFSRPRLSARVGIDSGLVVVGAGNQKEAAVFGETPNIAARVQSVASPGTVAITEATHRLVSGLFVVEERGLQPLKGIEEPLTLYRVVQVSGVRGRLQALAAARALTPFVGREEELRTLINRWNCALESEGQVALIIGEAGIGKSRLLQRFQEQIAETPHTWVEAAAGALYQNTPFYPITELLRALLNSHGDEPSEEQLMRLGVALEIAGLKSYDAVPLIAPLLNLPLPEAYPPLTLSSEQQRRLLLATLVECALGAARLQPTVIATEDLHWADPSTLELIQLLVEQGATARLLLLYTTRPEFHVPWTPRAHHTHITLNRLSERNVRTMVEEVAAQKALSKETITTVVERTGGVPLFVEELTRAMLESGDGKLGGHEIPVTLHDSLMARLDRLGSAKEVAQVGAVIGSEFSYELLHAVHPIAEEDLQGALRKLADAELIYVHGIPPEANYTFKHALIRDAAYEALLKSRRKEAHRLVARTMDGKFPALKETHPEVLARHWTEAGEIEPAIAEWSRAGKTAQAHSAFREAQESYEQALTLVSLLPESPERDLRELELRQSVVMMLWITRGYASPEAIDTVERASALAEKSGNLTQILGLMNKRGFSAYLSGDLPGAGAIADKALKLALRAGVPSSLGEAHILQMATRYWRGDLVCAEKHFTAVLKFFDDPVFRRFPEATVSALGYATLNAWMLGQANVAREREARMMAAANGNNPYQVVISGIFAATLRICMREYEQAEALAVRALELSEKNHFPQYAAWSRCFLGQARAQLDNATEGITLIRQGIAELLEVGTRSNIVYLTTFLAAAQECEGSIVDALETVEQALQANPDELIFRPWTLGLRGELRLKQGQTELAEADFGEAIELAQKIGAKAWELRATTSLARLLAKQGKRDEARAILAEIYNWFTEGFDTADLKDAKALLDQLVA